MRFYIAEEHTYGPDYKNDYGNDHRYKIKLNVEQGTLTNNKTKHALNI